MVPEDWHGGADSSTFIWLRLIIEVKYLLIHSKQLVIKLLHLYFTMHLNGFKTKDFNPVKSARLQLTPRFANLVAQAGLSQRAFARKAGVSFSTIMGLLHPEMHPGRRGGMQRRTAWLIARAYAETVGTSIDTAFCLLIVEEVHAGRKDEISS
jgi:hypothetical protein